APMKPSPLNLIVLRSSDIAKIVSFYALLGLEFVEEQHGSGPVHYACALGGVVLEIYPGTPGAAPDRKAGGATMIGLRVEALDALLATLQENGYTLLSPAKETP